VANWQFLFFIFVVVSVADYTDVLKKDLETSLGYWGGWTVGMVASVAVLTGVCVLLRWGWRAGLALGVTAALAVNTFGELRTAVTPVLGGPGAFAVAIATALVVCGFTWALLTRLLKLRW
jgi:hypothetical protein